MKFNINQCKTESTTNHYARTRDGKPAVIYSETGDQIHGAYFTGTRWISHAWSHAGRFNFEYEHRLDLVNEPTTVKGWLETLPDGYRELALNNLGANGGEADDLVEALIHPSFGWSNSREGADFWRDLYNHYRIPEQYSLPPLPEKEEPKSALPTFTGDQSILHRNIRQDPNDQNVIIDGVGVHLNMADLLENFEEDAFHHTWGVPTHQLIEAIDNQIPDFQLNEFVTFCHNESTVAGWWPKLGEPEPNIAEKLCLIHSEVSEAMEGYRKDLMDNHLPHRKMIEVELADALIRIGDLAGYLGLDLAGAATDKLAYNRQRADHSPEARAQKGGKKF